MLFLWVLYDERKMIPMIDETVEMSMAGTLYFRKGLQIDINMKIDHVSCVF